MKKGLIIPLLLLFLLSGCGHQHVWREASCTEAKTCTDCGATEGEALGHQWQEADCTMPETCLRCGLTEGEALGHEGSPADYQHASACQRCGIELAEALTPDFELYGLRCEAESGVSYDYHTCSKEDSSVPVVGKVTITEDSEEEKPVNLEDIPGYEWRFVDISMEFDDKTTRLKGVRWSICCEDYYSILLHDDTLHAVDGGCDGFTVYYNGIEYPECQRYYEYDNGHWDKNTYYMSYGEWFRIPVGYDGVVVGVRDGSIEWPEGKYIYDVADENALFYRLK